MTNNKKDIATKVSINRHKAANTVAIAFNPKRTYSTILFYKCT